MKIKIFLLFFLLLLFTSCILQNNENFIINRIEEYNNSIIDKNGWLIMIYISGSGNLEEESISDINNIKEGYCNNNSDLQNDIDIVILHDRGPGYSTSENDWTGTYLYKCEAEGLIPIIKTDGWRKSINQEENMGSKQTLDNFIAWSKKNYHRTKESLIIWNHGGGLSGQVLEKSRAVSWDIENTDGKENDALYVNEIQEILGKHYNYNSKLEILGFDACFMGMIEIAYEYRNLVNFMVASPGVETGGWQYKEILTDLHEEITDKELSQKIVKSYKTFTDNYNLENSLSSFELNKVSNLKDKIDLLSGELIKLDFKIITELRESVLVYYDKEITNENILYPYVDIGDLLNKAQEITMLEDISKDAIYVLEEFISYSFDKNGNTGVSIFFTDSAHSYSFQDWYTNEESSTFGGVDFCLNDKTKTNWKNLMDFLYTEKGNYEI